MTQQNDLRSIEQKVGCEREDGALNIHPESETCEVCAVVPSNEEVSVTLTGAEFQELMSKEQKLRAEIAEGDRINGEAVNIRTELERQLYAMTQERDTLLKWRERVIKAVGEQPVETSALHKPDSVSGALHKYSK